MDDEQLIQMQTLRDAYMELSSAHFWQNRLFGLHFCCKGTLCILCKHYELVLG